MTIRAKAIMIIMLVALILTTASFFTSISFTDRSLTEAIENDLSFAIEVADGLISTKMQLLRANAMMMAERLLRVESTEEMAGIIDDHIASCPDCISQSIFDRNGVILDCGGIPITLQEIQADNDIIEMVYGGMTIVSSPYYSTVTGDFIMRVYTPLETTPGSESILALTMSGMMFSDLVSGYKLWQTGNIYIINEEGTIIADVEAELVLNQKNFIKEFDADPDSASDDIIGIAEYLRQALSKEKGIDTYKYKGVERLCSYRLISGTLLGWRVAVAAPLVESPKTGVQQGLALAALFFLLIGLVLSVIMSKFVAKPYYELEEFHKTVSSQNERTKLLLDATPLACRLWNREFEIFNCNEESLRLFNIDNEQEFIDNYFDLSPELQPDGKQSKEKAKEIIRKAFEGERVVVDWVHRMPDGSLFPTEITLIRVPYEGDYAVAGYTRDLREHNKMMEEIERRDRMLSTGNRTAEILLTTENVIDVDEALLQSMEIVGFSTGVDRVHIWRNREIDGDLCFELSYKWLSDFGRQCTPLPIGLRYSYSDSPGWKELFLCGECINGPLSDLNGNDRGFLEVYGMKSIVIIPLFIQEEFWGFFSLDDCQRERSFDEDGVRILRSISLMMANAINRSTQAERIREAHERSRVLMDSAPFGMNLWNRDCVVFECNEESVKLFGLNSKEEYLERFNELSPEYQPDGMISSEKTVAQIQEAFENGYSACEWLHQKPDGTQIPAEALLVRVPYGNDFAVAGYTRDLREHKAMMQEIEERDRLLEAALNEAQKANRAKSDFLANMSHEMRTPLNAVIGLSELCLDSGKVEGEDYSNLEKIYSAGSTLLNLINDILDISKIEAGMLELVEMDYDVPSLINDTITQNTIRIGEKPIEFKLEIGKEVFMHLRGDELRVKQIINNLLSNAIKYTDEGIVEMALHNTRERDVVWFSIKVSDTGRGIKPEDIDMLFLDYTQMDKESNRHIEGTGLGLPITRRLADVMGGSVNVESEYGKGSVFTVTIRQGFISETTINDEIINSLKSFRYSVSKRDRNTAIRHNITGMPYASVLIVDDNATNLDVAKGLMSPYKMSIDCVDSGQKAVEAMRTESKNYNAVFMDHMMPGMDGVKATQAIRDIGTDYAKNIPIIAMTANTIIGSEEMYLSNGFQDFLPKPIDTSRLDEVLRRWVRNKELEKSLEDRSFPPIDQAAPGSYYEQDRRKVTERRSGIERRKLFAKFLGLDFERGKERFGGSEEAFIDILGSYAQNTRPLLAVIEHVSEDSLAEYATIVHGIKGASRGILANMIGDSAENLENAAKIGDFAYVEKHNQTFIDAVMKLIRDIDGLLHANSIENPKPMKDSPDIIALQRLLDACKSYSMDEADAAMVEIDSYQYKQDDGLVEWLRENLKLTNFRQIIEKLSGLG